MLFQKWWSHLITFEFFFAVYCSCSFSDFCWLWSKQLCVWNRLHTQLNIFFPVQRNIVLSVWIASKIPPAPNVAISSVLLVSAKPCSMSHTVLFASMYYDLLLGISHKVDKWPTGYVKLSNTIGLIPIMLFQLIVLLVLYCHRSCMGSRYPAIWGTIPYRLATTSQVEYRVRSTLTLADHSQVPPELPTFLIHLKEGKFCR